MPSFLFRRLPWWSGALLMLLMLLMAGPVRAQVVVAPKAINLSDEERFASVFVENRTNQPQEVRLDFEFGYPMADSLGNVSIRYGDEKAAARFSAGRLIRAYPEQFLLPPGKRQRVRLALNPPDDWPDGVYWSRLAFTASQYEQQPAPAQQAGLSTKIYYRFRQVISVFYRRGSLETGLRFQDLRALHKKQKVYITSRVRRTGNAPFLGTARLEVTNDSTGTTVATQEDLASVYFDMTHRFVVNTAELPAGTYRARVQYVARREDVPAEALVAADAVSRTLLFPVK